MGRRNVSVERRAQIVKAFAKVLAEHGFAGSTMVSVAEAAEISPGLIHHHFRDKRELLFELFSTLVDDFKKRLSDQHNDAALSVENYIESALKLDHRANTQIAKCWVGVFAEALRDNALMSKMKRHLKSEIDQIRALSAGQLQHAEASALLSYIIGALVFGAFAPKKSAGFASEQGIKFLQSLSI